MPFSVDRRMRASSSEWHTMIPYCFRKMIPYYDTVQSPVTCPLLLTQIPTPKRWKHKQQVTVKRTCDKNGNKSPFMALSTSHHCCASPRHHCQQVTVCNESTLSTKSPLQQVTIVLRIAEHVRSPAQPLPLYFQSTDTPEPPLGGFGMVTMVGARMEGSGM